MKTVIIDKNIPEDKAAEEKVWKGISIQNELCLRILNHQQIEDDVVCLYMLFNQIIRRSTEMRYLVKHASLGTKDKSKLGKFI